MTDSCKVAILICVNDNPATGNVLNLSNIVQPRESYNEYRVGDMVMAKCPEYGLN